mgnify:CR=1 FL=1
MPLFEFQCRKCGHQFEELMTVAEVEAGKVKCPACASKSVEREFSAFATGSDGSSGLAGGGGGGGSGGFT